MQIVTMVPGHGGRFQSVLPLTKPRRIQRDPPRYKSPSMRPISCLQKKALVSEKPALSHKSLAQELMIERM